MGLLWANASYWSLQFVPDLPAARRGRDGRKKRGPGGASMTLPDSASATWKGKLEVFGGVSRSFRSLLCILKWFNYGRLCIWTATAVFFFLSFQRHKELSLVCWFWRMLRTIYSGCWLYYGFCVYVCAPCHHVAVGSKYQILIWIKKKKKKMTTVFK